MSDEQDWISAAKAGDQKAISALYQANIQAVYRYVMGRVQDEALAEDITADVFVRALETLPHYEPRDLPFLGWLYRIAAGKVIDYYRWAGRRGQNQLIDDALPDSQDGPEHLAAASLQQATLLRYLHRLTEEQQQVISLRFMQGYNLKDTAELMGKNENAIKALQFRALKTLAEWMEAEK